MAPPARRAGSPVYSGNRDKERLCGTIGISSGSYPAGVARNGVRPSGAALDVNAGLAAAAAPLARGIAFAFEKWLTLERGLARACACAIKLARPVAPTAAGANEARAAGDGAMEAKTRPSARDSETLSIAFAPGAPAPPSLSGETAATAARSLSHSACPAAC